MLVGTSFNPMPPSRRRTKISLRSIFASPMLGRDGATNASPLRGFADGTVLQDDWWKADAS
ncbi:MAG: hypothetical protein HDS06_09970 [Bacteroides sp.]|nr:hypothetical protein [Bacteroides sp.]